MADNVDGNAVHNSQVCESGDGRQRDVKRVHLFVKKFLRFLYYSCDDDLQWRRSSDWIAFRRECYNSRQSQCFKRESVQFLRQFLRSFLLWTILSWHVVENQHSWNAFARKWTDADTSSKFSRALLCICTYTSYILYILCDSAVRAEKQVHRAFYKMFKRPNNGCSRLYVCAQNPIYFGLQMCTESHS